MKKTKRVVRSMTVQLYQKHSDIIDRIQEEEDISGRIRTLILEYGEKAFPTPPAYAEAMKMRAVAKQKEARPREGNNKHEQRGILFEDSWRESN